MEIKNHLLYDNKNNPVQFVDTPNKGGVIQPKYLIMHYTAGASAASSALWLSKPEAKASAHIIIGRRGNLIQMVPFNIKAWHAGKSRWLNLTGLNNHSIGIELDNAGVLKKSGSQYKTFYGSTVPNDEVIEEEHKNEPGVIRGWHAYTEEQLEAAKELTILLRDTYNPIDVLGHDDIAPSRKIDPGPAFPMQRFKSIFDGRAQDEYEPVFFTTAPQLHIRTGPGTRHDPLEGGPLPQNTRVMILNLHQNWCFVEVVDEVNGVMDMEGWVSGKYLQDAPFHNQNSA